MTPEEVEKARTSPEFDARLMTVRKDVEIEWFYIPHSDARFQILTDCHSIFHIGSCKMREQLLRDKIVWPRIQHKISNFVKTCSVCQMTKSTGQVHVPYRTIISTSPLQHLYFDITFLTRDNQFIGVLTIIDHFTKRVWAKPIKSRHAVVIKGILIEVFEEIGLSEAEHPEFEMTLWSDNGAELVCQAIVDICLAYGIKKREGAPYAPWMQGVVERVQGTIKRMLKAYMEDCLKFLRCH